MSEFKLVAPGWPIPVNPALSTGAPWANAVNSPAVTMESLGSIARQVAREKQRDERKVFAFSGTMEQFKEALKKQGVAILESEDLGLTVASDGTTTPPPPWVAPGLQVIEFFGTCYVGTPESFRAIFSRYPSTMTDLELT